MRKTNEISVESRSGRAIASSVVPVSYAGPDRRRRLRQQPSRFWPILLYSPAAISLVGFAGALVLHDMPFPLRWRLWQFPWFRAGEWILAISFFLAIPTALISLFLYAPVFVHTRRPKTSQQKLNVAINVAFLLLLLVLVAIQVTRELMESK